jgi:hypothetical protein
MPGRRDPVDIRENDAVMADSSEKCSLQAKAQNLHRMALGVRNGSRPSAVTYAKHAVSVAG